ncbi:GspE/PulE family protein [Variovorax sp. HJSM1_2]|uniref:GspE/PulE family protein n=1 Tax=Variovorax sp. HJSM1_2 TaxID=3366263 RepID=UPI003BCE3FA5
MLTTPSVVLHPVMDSTWLAQVLDKMQPGLAKTLPVLPAELEPAWALAAASSGLTPWALAREVARQYGLRIESLPASLPAEAATWLNTSVAREHDAVVLRHLDGYLVVAVSNPAQPDLYEDLRFACGIPIELVVAPPADIRALRETLGPDVADEADAADTGAVRTRVGEISVEDQVADVAVVRLSNLMLRQAIERGASDVHVQPVSGGGLVRMRIDGQLRKVGRLPLPVMMRLITRVKAVAGMDPTDRTCAQDGHIRAVLGKRRLDLRIATLPVAGGEKLVVRLLGGHSVVRMADLGLPEGERQQLQGLINSSMGVVLVAGPTGSGKTTTLYSVLAEKNTTEVNIVTVEDPVEIRMPRLAQTEVNPKAGLSFASALRSVVRQDPDIILIGEIRDRETAGIAMQAAITGHLVFASVHANDAVSVLPRLTDLGVAKDLAAEAVRGIVSQRLVRALCHQCTQPAQALFTPAEAWLHAHAGLEGSLRAVGCTVCGGTGYRGRRAIMQVLTNSAGIARLLAQGAPLSDVRALARKEGMRFLSESALDRVRRGFTTVDEVLRVMGADFWREIGEAVGVQPPDELIKAVALGQDVEDRGAILLVAKDAEWRNTLTDWLKQLAWRIQVVNNEQDVWDAIERDSDFALLVVDTEQLVEERVRLLLTVRDSLAGAALPMLAFESGDNAALDQYIGAQEHTRMAPRPASLEQFNAFIKNALAFTT